MPLRYVVFFCALIVALFVFGFSKRLEGFAPTGVPFGNSGEPLRAGSPWSSDLLERFIQYQKTTNANNTQYNLQILQQQATPEEAEYLMEHGVWPWPDDLQQAYLEHVRSSPIVRIEPQYALNYAMKTYNANAVTQMLMWNTPEGQSLLNGFQAQQIFCSPDGQLTEIQSEGYNRWNGFEKKTSTVLTPDQLPSKIPGFEFTNNNNHSCNPCKAVDQDYSCGFRLSQSKDKWSLTFDDLRRRLQG